MNKYILLLIGLVISSQALADIEAHKVEPFLKQHCIKCHGEDKQKGDMRLDQFDKMDSGKWQLVYEQLYHEEMPPSDKPQPSKEERKGLMAYILNNANEEESVKNKLSTGYRKMNQREYNHTVRDLLGLNKGDFNPGKLVYSDTVEKGFDTEAESLVMSSELLLEYLNAAEKSVNQALFTEDYSRPESKVVSLKLKKMSGGDRRFTTFTNTHLITRDGGTVYFNKSNAATQSGEYKVSITAEPVDHFKNHDGSENTVAKEMLLAIGTKQIGGDQSDIHFKNTHTIKNKSTTYTETLWLDKDYTVFVKYANGHPKPSVVTRKLQRRRKLARGKKAVIPGIKITEIKIEGPITKTNEWPPSSFKTTFSQNDMPDLTEAKKREVILYKFLARAYRRIPINTEFNLYKDKLIKEYKKSNSWHHAMVKTFSAIMVSPDFLYIKTSQDELTDFELATRLSYFFWSSMPDKELFNLASKGELKDPKVYREQVARMYKDEKTQRFMESFVTQWLSLDKMGTMPPAKKGSYDVYYKLEEYFRQETVDYFKHVLLENRSINEFIDSDYTFLNKKLASFYEVPFSKDNAALEKVKLPSDSPRGGIITHASVLTLTANGVETTPIERGHWVLDELMGTPPPPPPKEVAALTPDLRGIKTVREQLVKHRSDPNCIQCHLKMDPPGFALEAFDPIGQYRTKYSKKQKIDTGGMFLGSKFKDIKDFKKVLLKNNHIIARNLVVKLAEYAKGRKLNLADLRTVDQIVKNSAKSNYTFRTMLGYMLESDLMMKH